MVEVIETLPVREAPVELDETGRVLLRAAEIVRERGWVQHAWGERGGPRCMMGAISEPLGDATGGDPSYEAAAYRLLSSLGVGRLELVPWNNTPGRTADEVAEALERAAYGL